MVDVVLACEEDVIKFLHLASFEAYSCALAGASFALSSLYVFGRLVAGKVLVNILDHLKQDFAERCRKNKNSLWRLCWSQSPILWPDSSC